MKTIFVALWLALLTVPAVAAVTNGKSTPDFSAISSEGKTVKLSDFKGKTVVLEWTNNGCPFVKKHYDSGNMQGLQKDVTGKGVVWLTIISSKPGSQGHMSAAQIESYRKEKGTASTAVLIDEKGEIGRLYGAQTTPHMYVIDPKGLLAYQGAIDDKPSTDKSDIAGAKPLVKDAVSAVLAGKPVAVAQTKAYGCGVKY